MAGKYGKTDRMLRVAAFAAMSLSVGNALNQPWGIIFAGLCLSLLALSRVDRLRQDLRRERQFPNGG